MLHESLLKKHFAKRLQTESLTHLQVLLREIIKIHIYFLESTNHTHHHYLPNPNPSKNQLWHTHTHGVDGACQCL